MYWKIWYENEVITGTTVQEWIDAPDEGVLGAIQYKGLYKGYKSGSMHGGGDWYWMLPNGTIQNSSESTYDVNFWLPCPAPDGAFPKKGKWTSEERINQVILEVRNEFANG